MPRPWQLPRLRSADDLGGALIWFRRTVRLGVSRSPPPRPAGTDERPGARVELTRGRGSVGNIGLVTVATVPDPRHAIPLHGTFFGFPSDHLGMEVQVSIMSGTPEVI